MSRSQHDPEGLRLPIKLDSTSNGEFEPVPLEPIHHHARNLALANATLHARRLGIARRDFLVSLCGAATTLLAMNTAFLAGCKRGASYNVPREAALEPAAAESALAGNEFIFDVQGHFVNPTGAWTRDLPEGARPLSFVSTEGCAASDEAGLAYLRCVGRDEFIKDIFLDSDTDLTVLSFVPSTREGEPLTIEEATATAALVEKMAGTHRLYLHGRVNPNQPGDVEDMERLAKQFNIAAWKTYTQWGPDGQGFFLDDPAGVRMIEEARRLGVRNIAVHKGLPFGPNSYERGPKGRPLWIAMLRTPRRRASSIMRRPGASSMKKPTPSGPHCVYVFHAAMLKFFARRSMSSTSPGWFGLTRPCR